MKFQEAKPKQRFKRKQIEQLTISFSGGEGCLCMASMLHSVTQEHPQPTPAIIFLKFKVLFDTGYSTNLLFFVCWFPSPPTTLTAIFYFSLFYWFVRSTPSPQYRIVFAPPSRAQPMSFSLVLNFLQASVLFIQPFFTLSFAPG